MNGFSGLLALDRQIYEQIRLTSNLETNFDGYLYQQIKQKGIPYVYIQTDTVNLRPCLRFTWKFNRRLWRLGVGKYKLGKPFWKVLLFSYMRLTPSVMVGYLQAKIRRGEIYAGNYFSV